MIRRVFLLLVLIILFSNNAQANVFESIQRLKNRAVQSWNVVIASVQDPLKFQAASANFLTAMHEVKSAMGNAEAAFQQESKQWHVEFNKFSDSVMTVSENFVTAANNIDPIALRAMFSTTISLNDENLRLKRQIEVNLALIEDLKSGNAPVSIEKSLLSLE